MCRVKSERAAFLVEGGRVFRAECVTESGSVVSADPSACADPMAKDYFVRQKYTLSALALVESGTHFGQVS